MKSRISSFNAPFSLFIRYVSYLPTYPSKDPAPSDSDGGGDFAPPRLRARPVRTRRAIVNDLMSSLAAGDGRLSVRAARRLSPGTSPISSFRQPPPKPPTATTAAAHLDSESMASSRPRAQTVGGDLRHVLHGMPSPPARTALNKPQAIATAKNTAAHGSATDSMQGSRRHSIDSQGSAAERGSSVRRDRSVSRGSVSSNSGVRRRQVRRSTQKLVRLWRKGC